MLTPPSVIFFDDESDRRNDARDGEERAHLYFRAEQRGMVIGVPHGRVRCGPVMRTAIRKVVRKGASYCVGQLDER